MYISRVRKEFPLLSRYDAALIQNLPKTICWKYKFQKALIPHETELSVHDFYKTQRSRHCLWVSEGQALCVHVREESTMQPSTCQPQAYAGSDHPFLLKSLIPPY